MPTESTPELDRSTGCSVSGWGLTRVYNQFLSPVLRVVDVEFIPNCKYYYWFRITDNMICAGSRFGGKDSCQVSLVAWKAHSRIWFEIQIVIQSKMLRLI